MSIEIRSITKVFGDQKALDDVTFTISPGEIVGLLGPNGAGKSTLMKIITCFIPPTHGSAMVNGFDVLEQSLEVKKQIGYLPENNPLYTDMYVAEYLEFITGIHRLAGNRRSRIAHIIELTGLTDEQHKKIGALSKGYRQRVGLAQALIHDPDVLVLDEPTSGLDPNQLVEIRNLIKEIGKTRTVMLSTHIMQEVEAICNRAIIMDRGKIVADDATSVLLGKTSRIKILSVELDKNIDIDLFGSLPDLLKAEKQKNGNYLLHFTTDEDIRALVFKFAVSNNLTVLSMSLKEQKLENIFQQLTKNSS